MARSETVCRETCFNEKLVFSIRERINGVDFAALAVQRLGRQAASGAARAACADDHAVAAGQQGGYGVPADEPGAAQDHYSHLLSLR